MIEIRKISIRRWLVCVGLLCTGLINAQYATTLTVADSPSAEVKKQLEDNGSKLLTELNNAQGEHRALKLDGIRLDKEAASSLYTMWEVCPFRCDEMEVKEACLNTVNGYQVRNIPVIMEPRDGERFDEDRYQEIVLNYGKDGSISSLCFALSSVMYKQIMNSDREVTDLRRRSMVIDFVEQFRTAYNRKDMQFLEDVFSDDALIITGKVISRKAADGSYGLKPGVEYKSQTKRQYLTNLARVFANNKRINVVFEDVKVQTHRTLKHIYGVKLVQHWNADSYSDKGYLFLLWDFSDESKPQIYVRTWQPYEQTSEEQVFELSDFKLKQLSN